jgi:TonB family protein
MTTRGLLIIALWLSAFGSADRPAMAGVVMQHAMVRVAIVGFSGRQANNDALEAALRNGLAQSAQVGLIDPAQVKPAITGVGYDGSINMSRDEARRLGAAIGCDFFIIGRRDAFTRSEAKQESHEEALVGVMIVDARSGELAIFDLINERSAARDAAWQAVAARLSARAAGYSERMIRHRAERDAARSATASVERIEDLPDAESAAAAGFAPPEFINRVKPEYTDAADRADITATVEALAVFRADGSVGEIQITRWAGFGLDEAATRAIRQLQFKPASRQGRPISVRATVRYNFRRLNAPTT